MTRIALHDEEARIVRRQADDGLCKIACLKAEIAELESYYTEEAMALKEKWSGRIAPLAEELDRLDGSLKKHMKRYASLLFADGDSVLLKSGQLVRAVVRKVAFPKSREALIDLLEKLGFADVVKVKKSLDADAIEHWPDERLAQVGLQRKPPVETFDYSLRETKQ